jgi:hypothetical protein
MSPSRFAATLLVGFSLTAAPLAHAQQVSPAAQLPGEDSSEDQGFKSQLRSLLVAEKFDEIDRMADEFRHNHTRVKNGEWKLNALYEALDQPRLSDQDTLDHLAHLHKWVAERPESMTARLALATSLHRWAWVARGNGMANTVSAENWKLFEERHMESLRVLEAAEKLPTRDPQLYLKLMDVGVATGWDKSKMRSLMDQGLAIEPEYFYFQRKFANYLLPKWYGELGDSARFAREAADRLGGERGDQMYYYIAGVLLKRGDGDFPASQLDWQRIQRGFHSIGATFGNSMGMQNHLAFMAYKFHDTNVALAQFSVIGDRWEPGVWRDRKYFDRIRDWAHGVTPNA